MGSYTSVPTRPAPSKRVSPPPPAAFSQEISMKASFCSCPLPLWLMGSQAADRGTAGRPDEAVQDVGRNVSGSHRFRRLVPSASVMQHRRTPEDAWLTSRLLSRHPRSGTIRKASKVTSTLSVQGQQSNSQKSPFALKVWLWSAEPPEVPQQWSSATHITVGTPADRHHYSDSATLEGFQQGLLKAQQQDLIG